MFFRMIFTIDTSFLCEGGDVLSKQCVHCPEVLAVLREYNNSELNRN